MRSAAIIRVESVRPETGLFEDPIIPTRLPETVEKKKPTNEHYNGCQHSRPNQPRNVDIKEAHEYEHQGNQAKDHLGTHITFGTRQLGLLLRGLSQVGKCFSNSGRQALPHSVQGVSGADQHSPNGDGSNDEPPNRHRQRCPIVGRISRKILFELWSKKEYEQWNE